MIALIGCGYWGKNLARNLFELDQLSLIIDPTETGKRHAKENAPGVPVRDHFDFGHVPSEIKGVVIATPAVHHYEHSKQALEAGLDVFCEKPLALKADEARELVTIAEQHKRILMVGHVLEYHPAFLKLHDLIRKGELGELRYLYSNRLSLGKIRTEENILWSFAPHDIALLLRMTGEMPSEVQATGGAWVQPHIHDVTLTDLMFPGGIRAHIHVSWLHPFKEHRFVAIGSEKMAVYNDVKKKLELYDQRADMVNGIPTAQKSTPATVEFEEKEPLKEECRAFAEAIRTRTSPLTDGYSAVRVLEVLEAAQGSLQENGVPQKVVSSGRPEHSN
ncbi:MAG: Gfo/Idh/MocA family oxidoreductase [Balneolales bacterium]